MIGIVLGSDSDLPKIRSAFDVLDEFGVTYDVKVYSAHRTPARALEWASTARERGIKVIIAVAGGAAHLPGVVAAHTTLPVIGVPIETKVAGGLDSLLSIVQMPSGIPVATMPTGKSGGKNAALYALSILAVSDESIAAKLQAYREKMAEEVMEKNRKIEESGLRNYINSLENN